MFTLTIGPRAIVLSSVERAAQLEAQQVAGDGATAVCRSWASLPVDCEMISARPLALKFVKGAGGADGACPQTLGARLPGETKVDLREFVGSPADGFLLMGLVSCEDGFGVASCPAPAFA